MARGSFGQACLLKKDRASGVHAHAGPHIMLQIEGADHEYWVGSESVPLTRHSAVLVNQHVLHGNRALGAGHSIVLMLYLAADWAQQHHHSALPGTPLFTARTLRLWPELRQHADALAAQMYRATDVEDAAVQDRCVELIQAILDLQPGDGASRRGVDKLSDFRIRRAIALMRENMEEPLSADQLSQLVGLSRSRFFELFVACTGLSPKQYCKMLRLEFARNRLASGSEPIADISRQCGFGAQSHFSHFFAGQLGITPSEFRRAGNPVCARAA
ncbi:MAG: helix-turn-helix domain-containing protein [Burkholderiaceae bacterium]